jgi:hypothetical protein
MFEMLYKQLGRTGLRVSRSTLGTMNFGELTGETAGPEIAIDYQHDGETIPAPGIIVLGKIDSDVQALNAPGAVSMVADMLEGQTDAMAEIMTQQSIGRLSRAGEVAAAVLWLCSPAMNLAMNFVIGVRLPAAGDFTAH